MRREEAYNGRRWGMWRLNGMKANTDQRMCPVRRKKDGATSCDVKEQKNWRDKLLEKRFTSIDMEIRIRKFLVRSKAYDHKLNCT
jgi:hypothetical protein